MLKTDFKTLFANKLSDPLMVYWTSNNLDLIIKEAQLTFAAIAGYWKDEVLIETTNSASLIDKQFYNLLVEDDVKTGFELVEVTQTYQDILDWLEFDLIGYEEIAGTSEVVSLITDAINNFQSETKLVIDKARFNIAIGQSITITEDVLDVLAAYYIDSNGNYNALQLADENRVALFDAKYINVNAKPRFYSINNISLHIVDLFPRPNENGYLELVYVKGKLGAQTEASSCLIPNNFAPYLKYKVLFDLFSKDEHPDPNRAAYCKQRWEEGLLIGSNYAIITNSKINAINKIPSSLKDFDRLRYGWREDLETSTNKVNSLALAGYNLIALNRVPINTHSLLFEVITNAPIGDDFIDLRSDYMAYFLDYCFHLALIKDGAVAIQKSIPALENFVKMSVEHNRYLQRRRISYLDLLQKSKYPIKQAKVMREENAA
jgi:hypothetical protein